MKKVLLYHIYPVNNWKAITEYLFQKLPFDKIVVHVSMPIDKSVSADEIEKFFKKYQIDSVLYSSNSGNGEVDALKRFVSSYKLGEFDILTYMHCKGVTKPDNVNIFNWTKLMRYFIIEKMDVCERVFKRGYIVFGINKTIPDKTEKGFIGSNFFYEGNFISFNLRKVKLDMNLLDRYLENNYYGLEGFWGKTCEYKFGYSVFNSGINHYMSSLPEKNYMSFFGRLRYEAIKMYYIIRRKLLLIKN